MPQAYHNNVLLLFRNCFVPHLMKYVFAKLLFAVKRLFGVAVDESLTDNQMAEFYSKWRTVLLECGMNENSNAFAAGVSLFLAALNKDSVDDGRRFTKMSPPEEGELLREYFRSQCSVIPCEDS